MKMQIYAVKDVMVGFSQPFVMVNDNAALRSFIASVRSPEPNIANSFPEHKQLWKIGELDDETGVLTSDIKHLGNASTYVLMSSPLESLGKGEDIEVAVNENWSGIKYDPKKQTEETENGTNDIENS